MYVDGNSKYRVIQITRWSLFNNFSFKPLALAVSITELLWKQIRLWDSCRHLSGQGSAEAANEQGRLQIFHDFTILYDELLVWVVLRLAVWRAQIFSFFPFPLYMVLSVFCRSASEIFGVFPRSSLWFADFCRFATCRTSATNIQLRSYSFVPGLFETKMHQISLKSFHPCIWWVADVLMYVHLRAATWRVHIFSLTFFPCVHVIFIFFANIFQRALHYFIVLSAALLVWLCGGCHVICTNAQLHACSFSACFYIFDNHACKNLFILSFVCVMSCWCVDFSCVPSGRHIYSASFLFLCRCFIL